MNDWFEAERRIERAQQLTESHRWEEALAEIDAALSINPNHAIWHAQRGFILEELGRFEEAVSAYEAALEQEPDDPDVALALGTTLSQLGRLSRALEVFEELARRYPDLEPAYCHRIGIYAELGFHDRAEEMFYLAQELNESCAQCFYQMGSSLAARGEYDRALYCWRRVLELDAECVGVNRRIAQVLRAQGKLSAARGYYLREVRDDPGNTDLLYELAELLFDSGDLSSAAAKFGQVLELDAGHVESHFMLGKIWLGHRQPGQALACFEAVDSLSEDEARPLGFECKMGEALLGLARFAEARRWLELAVEEKPDDMIALDRLGDCLFAMKKWPEAADIYRRILAQDTNLPTAHSKLAACLLSQGRPEAALDHCKEALRPRPDFAQAMHTAVLAHLQLAQWRSARAMLRRALRTDPHNNDLRQLAGRIWRMRLSHLAHRFARILQWRVGNRGVK